MAESTEVITIRVETTVVKEIDKLAKEENRTRSNMAARLLRVGLVKVKAEK